MITENKQKSRVCDVVSVVIDPTDITSTDHKSEPVSGAVEYAAVWLASQPGPVPHVVPVLKERFHLSGLQACQAIALARSAPAKDHTPKQEGEV